MAKDNFALGLGVVAGLGYLFTQIKDKTQTHDAEMVYRKYKGRKGPALSATSVKRGTRRRGNDGNMWEVRKSGKSQRWFKGAESFGAEGRSFEVRDLEGNTYTLKQVSDVQLNEMKAFGDDRAYNKNIFFVDGMNGIAFYEGDRASWFGGLDYDEPKTTVIDEEGQKYDMWEKYLMEEIAEEKYMETGRGPYGFDDTNVYMTYFIMFLRDNNDEPINPQQFGFNAESFGAVPISGTGSSGQMCDVCNESDDLPYDSDHFKECGRCNKSVCHECWDEMESDENYYEICGECWTVLDNVAQYDAESFGAEDNYKLGNYADYEILELDTHSYLMSVGHSESEAEDLIERYEAFIEVGFENGDSPYEIGISITENERLDNEAESFEAGEWGHGHGLSNIGIESCRKRLAIAEYVLSMSDAVQFYNDTLLQELGIDRYADDFEAEKKNCGCGQDPCVTYGAEMGAESFEAEGCDHAWAITCSKCEIKLRDLGDEI
tara:strand:+ start:23794 stop:25263 length:1470 start_codon:yes stop_codon:yes gene_type:complete